MVDARFPPATDEARIRVQSVEDASALEAVRGLLREYRNWLAEHREVTTFADSILERGLRWLDSEIDSLPWEYRAPGGALFLATLGTLPVGSSALRHKTEDTGELTRVYVRPSARGHGIGRRLTQAVLDRARDLGYRRVVLDTLPTMRDAIHLYRDMGFLPTSAYWQNPVPDALFFEYRLDRPPSK